MSTSSDGKRVCCDAEGCDKMASLPIGLRSELNPEPSLSPPDISGWLFVIRGEATKHYCPQCAKERLSQMFIEREAVSGT